MPLREAEPLKLRDKAYVSFTEKLLARDIRPGQFVSQRELVEITGMPLGAIRELIPRLETDGLVKTVPQRGIQIAHLDLTLIRNAFQFRLFLEREAAMYFVRHAPDAELKRLREAHETVLAQAESGISPALIPEAQAVDWDLHDSLIAFLDNDIIAAAYRVNTIKIRLIRQEQTRLDGALVVPVMREHLRVLDAFDSRDPVIAADALGEHIANARNRAMRL